MIYDYCFDPEKFLKLREKRKQLIITGKRPSLEDAELFEFNDYLNQIYDYLLYKRRYIFLYLIKSFLQDEIGVNDFYSDYLKLTKQLRKATQSFESLEELKKVKNYSESYPLSILISNINVACDLYDADGFDNPKNDLKDRVMKKYKLYLNSDQAIDVDIELDLIQLEELSSLSLLEAKTKNSNYNDYQVLKEVMIIALIVVLIIFDFLKP